MKKISNNEFLTDDLESEFRQFAFEIVQRDELFKYIKMFQGSPCVQTQVKRAQKALQKTGPYNNIDIENPNSLVVLFLGMIIFTLTSAGINISNSENTLNWTKIINSESFQLMVLTSLGMIAYSLRVDTTKLSFNNTLKAVVRDKRVLHLNDEEFENLLINKPEIQVIFSRLKLPDLAKKIRESIQNKINLLQDDEDEKSKITKRIYQKSLQDLEEIEKIHYKLADLQIKSLTHSEIINILSTYPDLPSDFQNELIELLLTMMDKLDEFDQGEVKNFLEKIDIDDENNNLYLQAKLEEQKISTILEQTKARYGLVKSIHNDQETNSWEERFQTDLEIEEEEEELA
jgi:hypothetical protein